MGIGRAIGSGVAALAVAVSGCGGVAPATTTPAAATTAPTTTTAASTTTTAPSPTTITSASTVPPATSTATTPPPGAFALAAEVPVVLPAGGERFTNPGAIVFEDGEYHMLRNSFTAFPGRSVTHHLTSSDGLTWEEHSASPVFTSDAAPFGGGNAFIVSAYAAPDGTWVGYFYTWEGRFGTNVIGRATAPGPGGPWVADPEPVLTPGTRRAWDGASVIEPSVVKTEGGFLMYYGGFDAVQVGAIGLATSADGISWTKHDDPATTGDRFAESDPVLVGGAGWDGGTIGCPEVVAVDGGYLMTYDTASRRRGIGAARSPDGVAWARVSGNPVITTADVPGGASFYQSELVAGPDGLLFLLEVEHDDGTAVYPYVVDPALLG